MRSIDKRIVEMAFNNQQFEKGVATSVNSLDKLKEGLNMEGAAKGFEGLENAASNVNLSGIADGVDHISNRFSAMGAVGFTIIQELTTAALNFTKKISGVVLDPLVSGGAKRALNIEKAKFQFRGLGMDVEATMASALEAVTGTAYGLDEAAVAASQFGASGMRAGDDMTSALRAISGVAAMTGSSYSDISQVFTTVAGNGRLMGSELLRLSTRGVNAAATLAEEFGVTEQEIRSMVSEGEISFEMFYQAMDNAFGEHATKANDLYTGSLANVRAGLSRIGADVATSAFENQRLVFVELIPVLRDLHGVVAPAVAALDKLFGLSSAALVKSVKGINLEPLEEALPNIVDGLWNMGEAIYTVLTPIGEAFRQIFPPTTGDQLIAFSEGFLALTEKIKIGEITLKNIKSTFAGVFAVFSILRTVLSKVVSGLAPVASALWPIVEGLLEITAMIGDFLVGVDESLKGTGKIESTFTGIADVISSPVETIKKALTTVKEAFQNFDGIDLSGLDAFKDRVSMRFEPLGKVFDFVGIILKGIVKAFEWAIPIITTIAGFIGDALSGLGDVLSEAFAEGNFKPITDLLNSGILAMLMLAFERFANGLTRGVNRLNLFSYRGVRMLDGVRLSMESYQAKLKADVLLKIAAAIAILAAALVVISLIDSDKLAGALAAISVLFVELVASLVVLETAMKGKGFRAMAKTITMIMALSIAMLLLAVALRIIAKLDWESLLQGLIGMGAMMAMMVITVKALEGTKGGILRASLGLIMFAVALNIMAIALKTIGNIDPDNLAKGLIGIGVLMAQIALFMKVSDFGGTGIAKMTGLFILALALNIIAGVVKKLGTMDMDHLVYGMVALSYILAQIIVFVRLAGDSGKLIATATGILILGIAMTLFARALERMGTLGFKQIVKGLGALAGVLGLVIAAVKLMPTNTMASGGGLVLMAIAVNLMAVALEKMGKMSVEEIGKSLLVLAGSLTILTIALKFMDGNVKGAAALMIVSIALNFLAIALNKLGKMSMAEIAKSLGVLAGTLIIFGIAAAVLGPLVPVILALAGAMVLFGVAALAVGAGVFLLSIGLASLAVSGAAAAASLAVIIVAIAGTIPEVLKLLAQGIIDFIVILGEGAADIAGALVKIATAILEGFIEIVPLAVDAIYTMLSEILEGILEFVPEMYHAAIELILVFLKGIRDNIGEVVSTAIDIVVNFLDAVADKLPEVIDSAFKLIIAFIEGLADAIDENTDDLLTAIDKLIWAMIEAAAKVIFGVDAVNKLKKAAKKVIEDGFLGGIKDKWEAAKTAAATLRDKAIGALKKKVGGWWKAGRDGAAGFVKGLKSKGKQAWDAATGLAGDALNAAAQKLESKSPSKAFERLGGDADEGFANGLVKYAKLVSKAGTDVGGKAIDSLRTALAHVSEIIASEMDSDPTIRPVMDLDEIEKGSKLLDTLFAKRQAIDIDAVANRAESISSRLNQNGTDSQVSRVMMNLLEALNKRKPEDTIDLSGTLSVEVTNDAGDIIGIATTAIKDLLREESR